MTSTKSGNILLLTLDVLMLLVIKGANSEPAAYYGKALGSFHYSDGTSGDVYVADPQTLILTNFKTPGSHCKTFMLGPRDYDQFPANILDPTRTGLVLSLDQSKQTLGPVPAPLPRSKRDLRFIPPLQRINDFFNVGGFPPVITSGAEAEFDHLFLPPTATSTVSEIEDSSKPGTYATSTTIYTTAMKPTTLDVSSAQGQSGISLADNKLNNSLLLWTTAFPEYKYTQITLPAKSIYPASTSNSIEPGTGSPGSSTNSSSKSTKTTPNSFTANNSTSPNITQTTITNGTASNNNDTTTQSSTDVNTVTSSSVTTTTFTSVATVLVKLITGAPPGATDSLSATIPIIATSGYFTKWQTRKPSATAKPKTRSTTSRQRAVTVLLGGRNYRTFGPLPRRASVSSKTFIAEEPIGPPETGPKARISANGREQFGHAPSPASAPGTKSRKTSVLSPSSSSFNQNSKNYINTGITQILFGDEFRSPWSLIGIFPENPVTTTEDPSSSILDEIPTTETEDDSFSVEATPLFPEEEIEDETASFFETQTQKATPSQTQKATSSQRIRNQFPTTRPQQQQRRQPIGTQHVIPKSNSDWSQQRPLPPPPTFVPVTEDSWPDHPNEDLLQAQKAGISQRFKFGPLFAVPKSDGNGQLKVSLPNNYEITSFRWFGIYDHCKQMPEANIVIPASFLPPLEAVVQGLVGYAYGTSSGQIQIMNCNTILITNLTYLPSQNSDGYFYVGYGQFPSAIIQKVRAMVIGHPILEPLGAYRNADVVVRLPAGWRTFDIEWISILNPWASQSYGHALLPKYTVPPCEDVGQ